MLSSRVLTAKIDHLSKLAQVQQKALNADFSMMLKLEQADEEKHGVHPAKQSLKRLAAKVSRVRQSCMRRKAGHRGVRMLAILVLGYRYQVSTRAYTHTHRMAADRKWRHSRAGRRLSRIRRSQGAD